MKHATRILMLTSVMLSSSPVWAADMYEFDPMHSNIVWQANHFGFSSPSGRFTKAEGTLTLDEEKPERSKVEVVIYPGSVNTGIEKFDDHLRSKDFLDSEKFPTARFVSTSVEVTGKNTADVTGDFTLHGVTKPVVLEVTLNKLDENPMSHKKTAGFSAITTIKRSDFGINTALPGVSDKVNIDMEIEAIIKK
ncbi:polyisoprenoid-binding protein [bacterium]|nr:polyisoprenoid-binding protein [bacterium]